MKKDQKYLNQIETNLNSLSKKNRDKIIRKYSKIIEEEKAKKRKITSILKDLGKPEEIAKKEIENLKKEKNIKKIMHEIALSISKFLKKIFQELKKKFIKFKKKNKFTSFKKIKNKIKNKLKKEKTLKDNVKEIIEDSKDEISNITEIATEKQIFETKQERIKRIVLKIFGVILTTILLFCWLWIVVIFIASLFAILDGIKLYGLNIALFGLTFLFIILVISINKSLFKHKLSLKYELIFIIVSIIIISFGIALFLREISKIEVIHDVSEKYSMTRKYTKQSLSKDDKKYYITFNSNYNTDYILEYDETMKDKIGIEVKYYECYYDYYIKSNSNGTYISLKLDNRDRLSVYIDDLKEGKIYDNDELERYTIKIIGSKKDLERVIINK